MDQKATRGRGRKQQFLVKWAGYARLTWSPVSALEDMVVLDKWEEWLWTGKAVLGGCSAQQVVYKKKKLRKEGDIVRVGTPFQAMAML